MLFYVNSLYDFHFRHTHAITTDPCYVYPWACLHRQLDCLLCYLSFVRVCLILKKFVSAQRKEKISDLPYS